MRVTTRRAPKCHWDAGRGWLAPEHVADCKVPDCSGCRPCGKTHCAFRGSCETHVDAASGIITCPRCIGGVRRDLREIEERLATMPEEAEFAGVESEAANLAGPAAAPAQLDGRRRVDDHRGWCDFPMRDELYGPADEHHPYAVLGRWDLALRETYGPYTDLLVSVSRAVSYFETLMRETGFPHGDEFDDFATDVRRCRVHLEEVAHDSRRPEEGAPCPKCADRVDETQKAPRLQKRYAPHDTTGHSDTWHCPEVAEHWWKDDEYVNRVAAVYRDHAPELPAVELAERIGVPLSTLRKWTARTWDDQASDWTPPRLTSRRRADDGRKMYPVEQALRLAEAGTA